MLIRRTTIIALAAAAALAVVGTGSPAAKAATTCAYGSGVLKVSMTAHGDSASVETLNTTHIVVRGRRGAVACDGALPTTSNTDVVWVDDISDNPGTAVGNDGQTELVIHEPASFGPGKSIEGSGLSEVEFLFEMRGGSDNLTAGGSQRQDLVAGKNGLSWNTDDDADLVRMPSGTIQLQGGGASDQLSGQGGRGTGGPVTVADAFVVNGGEDGADALRGSDTRGDTIYGNQGNDDIAGGAGSDLIFGGPGDDAVDGGPADDMVGFQSGVTVDLGRTDAQDTGEGRDTLVQVEDLQGSSAADRLTGSGAANILDGGGGDDTLEGRGGVDDLRGRAGTDTVSYGQASAPVAVDLASSLQVDGSRLDSIESVIGSAFADTLTGNLMANRIVGGAGADTIAAGDGADRVEVRDSEGDRASCGPDADTAVSDRRTLDALEADCETVDALPEPEEQQPTDPTQPDTAADTTLDFSLSGARRQRLLRQRAVRVKVSSPLEESTIVASGSGRLRAVASSGLRATRLKLGPLTTSLAAGTTRTLKLRLTRRQLRALRKALAARQRPRVRVTVVARDAAGNTVERTLRVTARR